MGGPYRPAMPGKDNRRDWLTVVEAAELVNVHPKTVERVCRRGLVLAERPGWAWIVNRESLLNYWKASHAGRPEFKTRTAKGAKRRHRAPLRSAA